jgi:renalase
MGSSITVIGAGICGLSLAVLLQEKGHRVTVLEKSKGLGGRMATRRTANGKFDHGAQFYTLKEPIETDHERWLQMGLTHRWIDKNGFSCFTSSTGMASLAKELASRVQVQLEHKVVQIESSAKGWNIITEKSPRVSTDHLILTAPLPQSLDLLRKSGIEYPATLDAITYTKALVGLFENSHFGDFGKNFSSYTEDLHPTKLFSISNQHSKLLSAIPSWTITMNAEFSENFYDESDEIILTKMVAEIRMIAESFQFTEFQLKRWRYNTPRGRFPELYLRVRDGLYLAGDAFGGASILGALRSAQRLAKEIRS